MIQLELVIKYTCQIIEPILSWAYMYIPQRVQITSRIHPEIPNKYYQVDMYLILIILITDICSVCLPIYPNYSEIITTTYRAFNGTEVVQLLVGKTTRLHRLVQTLKGIIFDILDIFVTFCKSYAITDLRVKNIMNEYSQ